MDIFESDDVENSCPVSYQTINQYGGTTASKSLALARAHALNRNGGTEN